MTGISKEMLRKWEDRYGFPEPLREKSGRRTYSEDHIERLKLIKRLLDRGMRSGAVVPLERQALEEIAAKENLAVRIIDRMEFAEKLKCDDEAAIIDCLKSKDHHAIDHFLQEKLSELGLRTLICQFLPKINWLVGTAWADGRIDVHEEHLYSETIRNLLYNQRALTTAQFKGRRTGPKIILATAKGETHTIGLQLAQTLLTMEGAQCISLGSNLEAIHIALAASHYHADIVGLSFSQAYPVRAMKKFIIALKHELPQGVVLWVGGLAAASLQLRRPGLTVLTSMDETVKALRAFRVNHKISELEIKFEKMATP
jgi:methanogenic corrinoid protein MtbC1